MTSERDELDGVGVRESRAGGPRRGSDRSAEGEVTIDATVERVWRALTEASELERWFPLDARVERGDPGRIWMGWGNEIGSWSRIEVWDPPSTLRLSEQVGDGQAIVTEYRVERQRGATTVRVVTSGFPEDASWNDMVEGTRLGWVFELSQLKHYLERHSGQERACAYLRRRVAIPRDEAWERLETRMDPRSHVETILDSSPPWQLAGVSREPRDGLIRWTVDPAHDDPAMRDVSIWISAWGRDAVPATSAAREKWQRELARVFPEGEAREAGV